MPLLASTLGVVTDERSLIVTVPSADFVMVKSSPWTDVTVVVESSIRLTDGRTLSTISVQKVKRTIMLEMESESIHGPESKRAGRLTIVDDISQSVGAFRTQQESEIVRVHFVKGLNGRRKELSDETTNGATRVSLVVVNKRGEPEMWKDYTYSQSHCVGQVILQTCSHDQCVQCWIREDAGCRNVCVNGRIIVSRKKNV